MPGIPARRFLIPTAGTHRPLVAWPPSWRREGHRVPPSDRAPHCRRSSAHAHTGSALTDAFRQPGSPLGPRGAPGCCPRLPTQALALCHRGLARQRRRDGAQPASRRGGLSGGLRRRRVRCAVPAGPEPPSRAKRPCPGLEARPPCCAIPEAAGLRDGSLLHAKTGWRLCCFRALDGLRQSPPSVMVSVADTLPALLQD